MVLFKEIGTKLSVLSVYRILLKIKPLDDKHHQEGYSIKHKTSPPKKVSSALPQKKKTIKITNPHSIIQRLQNHNALSSLGSLKFSPSHLKEPTGDLYKPQEGQSKWVNFKKWVNQRKGFFLKANKKVFSGYKEICLQSKIRLSDLRYVENKIQYWRVIRNKLKANKKYNFVTGVLTTYFNRWCQKHDWV